MQAKFNPLFSTHSKLKIVATVLHFPISSTKNIFHLILLPDTQKWKKTWQQGLKPDTFGSWRTKIRKTTPSSRWFQIRDSFQGLCCLNIFLKQVGMGWWPAGTCASGRDEAGWVVSRGGVMELDIRMKWEVERGQSSSTYTSMHRNPLWMCNKFPECHSNFSWDLLTCFLSQCLGLSPDALLLAGVAGWALAVILPCHTCLLTVTTCALES